ncbi:uncharacterized protein SPPG_03225 [Spizellomyces punctatus DAOM BR117]|uniref:Uncharacterized protein n=1 Tax=Spizellomyces punctatus (strain DAOM BR117) TaxID=645134 RepID=A0A0L0HKQ4_SPIPD|nr:uncharacterized protein SPPG_03225 [Spizellomyces punctatus DAOM BR117]KND01419.1 hypothetical protein SPPG_03225 [Spizellomyces punctatus DAOM BR117]|eukprot:XP_016609458.1 hypothetical protein SPPG_03225 [Spizellomyces punctatus DAOM BR117]
MLFNSTLIASERLAIAARLKSVDSGLLPCSYITAAIACTAILTVGILIAFFCEKKSALAEEGEQWKRTDGSNKPSNATLPFDTKTIHTPIQTPKKNRPIFTRHCTPVVYPTVKVPPSPSPLYDIDIDEAILRSPSVSTSALLLSEDCVASPPLSVTKRLATLVTTPAKSVWRALRHSEPDASPFGPCYSPTTAASPILEAETHGAWLEDEENDNLEGIPVRRIDEFLRTGLDDTEEIWDIR